MRRMKPVCVCLCVFLFCILSVEKGVSQVDPDVDFDTYQSAIITDFYQFEDSINRDFADFLEQAWQDFTVYEGTEPPDYSTGSLIRMAYPNSSPAECTDTPVSSDERFFGTLLHFASLPGKELKLAGVAEKEIAGGWRRLAAVDFTAFLNSLQRYSTGMKLNDWGEYLLMKEVGLHQYPQFSPAEKTLFLFYVLSNSGYKVKIGRGENNALVLLLPFQQEVYRIPYIRIGGLKYYLMDADQTGLKTVYSFEGTYPAAHKTLSLSVINEFNFPKEVMAHTWTGKHSLTVELNRYLIDFYATYPLCDLSVYFQAIPSAGFRKALGRYVEKRLEGKGQLQRVAWLLSFVQQVFVHKPDKEVHGKEVYYFPEQICVSPYADCEDLSVLLSCLLKLYTDRQLLALYYPTHVAVAVENCEGYGGSLFQYKGKEYFICDPSYKGGEPGRVIPACKAEKPVVVSYDEQGRKNEKN